MTHAPRAAAALVSPACQVPTGVALGRERRRQLARWAERSGAWIFEDDFNWNGDGRSAASPPYAAGDRQRTIYFNSFNNLLFPGLRVAYLVAPSHLIERFSAIRSSEGTVNSANQVILTDFIEGGYLDAHLRRLDECNRERRAALADSVGRELAEFLEPRDTPGGYYICGLKRVSEAGAVSACSRANVVISGMSEFFLTPPVRNEIVLGFSMHRRKALSRSAAALRAVLAAGA
jgi:GntR family transcriptional regulator/MocR family aminotransferase